MFSIFDEIIASRSIFVRFSEMVGGVIKNAWKARDSSY